MPGTRDVYTIGGSREIVHVELDPQRVAGFGMTLDDPERGGLQRSDLPTAVKRVIAPVDAQLTTHVTDQEVYVSGTSRMASLWTDLTMVQNLLGLLEDFVATWSRADSVMYKPFALERLVANIEELLSAEAVVA